MEYYFNSLTQFGYRKDSDVTKLIVYIFISEILTGDMREFITEKDYRIIEKALYCLYGSSCLLPYPKYINEDNLFGHNVLNKPLIPRITEDSILRLTEDSKFRISVVNYND